MKKSILQEKIKKNILRESDKKTVEAQSVMKQISMITDEFNESNLTPVEAFLKVSYLIRNTQYI